LAAAAGVRKLGFRNVGVKHLLNIKTVAERRENMLWFRTPEKVYFKKGSCR
jgi:acetaldehyde dehydrogenase/alcohol dehydrogenase